MKDALEEYLADMLDYYEAEKRQTDSKRELISIDASVVKDLKKIDKNLSRFMFGTNR